MFVVAIAKANMGGGLCRYGASRNCIHNIICCNENKLPFCKNGNLFLIFLFKDLYCFYKNIIYNFSFCNSKFCVSW